MLGTVSELHQLKATLLDLGVDYDSFRQGLKPKFWPQYFSIFTVYFAFWLIYSCLGHANGDLEIIGFGFLGSIGIGICYYILGLYGHSAAHNGFTSNRKVNDILSNALIFVFFGESVEHYRKRHFMHHARLGQASDPENAYVNKLNLQFVAKYLCGLAFIKKLVTRNGSQNGNASFSILTLGLNLVILAISVWSENYAFIIAWLYGMACVLPLLLDTRLLLEHRDFSSGACTTKTFRADIVSIWFGAAGFRYHLMHHLDPSAHYTILPQLNDLISRASRIENVSYYNQMNWEN